MTTLIFDWSDWDGVAEGRVTLARVSWRRDPDTLQVPWSRHVWVPGRATEDVPEMSGEVLRIRWTPEGASQREEHVLVPTGPNSDREDGAWYAHLLERVDSTTLEPLDGDDAATAAEVLSKAAEAVERVAADAEQARDAATMSQESALSVLPMVAGSVTITPTDGTLAVDLGQAANVATGLAGVDGTVDVIFPPVTTPDGRVNPDGLGTLLRVNTGAERLTWPGGTVVHGTPPEGQAAMASLVRVGGSVTVVWPPDVVTSTEAGATAQVAEIEQIIGGEVEVQPGGTVLKEARPGYGAVPAVFVNPYSRPTSTELVLTVGKVQQALFIGYDFSAYVTDRPGGLTDYSMNMTVDLGTSGEPVKNWDGWLIAVAPGPAFADAKMTETLYDISRRVATSTLEMFTDGTWGVVLQYDADNPHWGASEQGGMAHLFYNEGDIAGWQHGMVLTSGLALPMTADGSSYTSLGITLPGTFHRAAELGDMGVYVG